MNSVHEFLGVFSGEDSQPGDVLTPLAACYLFGKDESTVRLAVLRGHVYSPFSFWLTGKEIRMLDLKSAIAYWGVKNVAARGQNLEHELEQMRLYGEYVSVNILGRKYCILQAGGAVVVPTPRHEATIAFDDVEKAAAIRAEGPVTT